MSRTVIAWALGASLAYANGLPAAEVPKDWIAEADAALTRAGANRAELEKAITDAPAEQKRAMRFLVGNMPDGDLVSLKASFLLENVALAYQARNATPWGKSIPEPIFFNNVLPYANVDEERDAWRKEMIERCLPMVKECKTPSEAAQLLNSKLFAKLNVKYSTQRKKAQQNPSESIANGTASCTGLSILLSDACRSVGVPTRLAGTPLWSDKRGNHTWVEIWDDGWHFTGACEADPKGLDRGWFVGDAAKAQKDVPEHAIYAASFERTKLAFPLVWAPGNRNVPAVNVTDHYAKKEAAADDRPRIRIRVVQQGSAKRVELSVRLIDVAEPKNVQTGKSRGETADANDFLEFVVEAGKEYLVKVGEPVVAEKTVRTQKGKPLLFEFEVKTTEKK